MDFGTWYQINCEGKRPSHSEFSRIREAGFDFVVLWNVMPEIGKRSPADMRLIIATNPEPTLRASMRSPARD